MRRALLMLAVIFSAGSRARSGELTVTFIGNEAFQITDGKVALLTDFPYDSGAFGQMEWTPQQVPRGPRALCLFTHDHADHFALDLLPKYYEVVLGPGDVERRAGVAMLPLVDPVRWKGITIRPIATPHSGKDPVEHESYLVEWQGLRLYFTGDAGDTSALLAVRDLDAAFVYTYLLEALAKTGARVDARRIVACHHEPGEKVTDVQSRLVPVQGQVLKLVSSRNPVASEAPDSTPIPVAPRTGEEKAFVARFASAQRNVRTGVGRQYDQGPFSQQFYQLFSQRLNECTQRTGEASSGMPGFDMAVQLAGDGRVLSALISPRTRLTSCFAKSLTRETFAAPPSPGFWVPVTMRFSKR